MKLSVKNMVLVSLFAALMAVGALVKIPLPYIPITLQYMFCAFSGLLLGSKLGALSQILYVIIGLAGVPVFTKGGGPGYIFQPSFGYLMGFIVCAYVIGILTEKQEELTLMRAVIASLAGLAIIYIIGLPYLYIILNFYLKKGLSAAKIFEIGFLIFVWKDIITAIITSFISVKVMKILRTSNMLSLKNSSSG